MKGSNNDKNCDFHHACKKRQGLFVGLLLYSLIPSTLSTSEMNRGRRAGTLETEATSSNDNDFDYGIDDVEDVNEESSENSHISNNNNDATDQKHKNGNTGNNNSNNNNNNNSNNSNKNSNTNNNDKNNNDNNNNDNSNNSNSFGSSRYEFYDGTDLVLRQVHVLSRHGASLSPLVNPARSRHANNNPSLNNHNLITFDEGGGQSLTPLGEEQMYKLGHWLQQQYQNQNLIDKYNPEQVRMESSDFMNTMTSANYLALGLFTTSGNGVDYVPIYTEKNINDVTIRSYDKCHGREYENNMQHMYETLRWKEMEETHSQLLQNLAKIPPFDQFARTKTIQHSYESSSSALSTEATTIETTKTITYIPLEHMVHVYDWIHLLNMECHGELSGTKRRSEVCLLMTDNYITIYTEDQWVQIQEIVRFVEREKYSYETIGNILGTNLLSKIVHRMELDNDMLVSLGADVYENEGVADAASWNELFNKFYISSVHYPTILSLFGALNQPFYFNDVIPDYSSAVIFELYQNPITHERFVKMFYKPGEGTNTIGAIPTMKENADSDSRDPAAAAMSDNNNNENENDNDDGDDSNNAIAIRFENIKNCVDQDICPLNDFMRHVQRYSIIPVEQWCQECQNDQADVCMAAQLHKQGTSSSSSSSFFTSSSCRDNNYMETFWVPSIFSIVGSILLGMVLTCVLARCTVLMFKNKQTRQAIRRNNELHLEESLNEDKDDYDEQQHSRNNNNHNNNSDNAMLMHDSSLSGLVMQNLSEQMDFYSEISTRLRSRCSRNLYDKKIEWDSPDVLVDGGGSLQQQDNDSYSDGVSNTSGRTTEQQQEQEDEILAHEPSSPVREIDMVDESPSLDYIHNKHTISPNPSVSLQKRNGIYEIEIV